MKQYKPIKFPGAFKKVMHDVQIDYIYIVTNNIYYNSNIY